VNAGFGAATGAQPMRTLHAQIRFTFEVRKSAVTGARNSGRRLIYPARPGLDYMTNRRERAIADNERYLRAGRSAQLIGDDDARPR
jgi:hypothetical protein